MPLFTIPANDIDTAGLSVDGDLPIDWLKTELEEPELTAALPGHFTARLSRTGEEIVVRGRVRAVLTTPCARCMDPSTVDVDTELTLLLHPAASPKAQPKAARKRANGDAKAEAKASAKAAEEEYEFTSQEAEFDVYDGESVVLDPFIREAI